MAASGFQPVQDLGVAAGLAGMLLLVYGIDLVMGGKPEPAPPEIKITEVEVPEQGPPAKALRIGVTPGGFDNMAAMLDTLGQGFKYENIPMEALIDEKQLAQYDIVFLCCGGVPDAWLEGNKTAAAREGTTSSRGRPEIMERLKQNIRKFVGKGGTLYASDWQFQIVRVAFPEYEDHSTALEGAVGDVQADVVDPGLQQLLGQQIQLNFDQPGWCTAAFKAPQMTTYLRGALRTLSGEQKTAPLLVKFPFEQGTVIFTSFHNEKQHSDVEIQLLKTLVFAAVTARTDAEITRKMLEGGFSPSNKSLLSASSEAPSVTQTYRCTKSGALQFVLGFENRGAELKLTVVDPSGKTAAEKSGAETFTIDLPDAAPGEWKYTITAVKIPYPNFPYTLTVGQK